MSGSFSQNGMWKVKSRLLPRPRDPPMAKKDRQGNLITSKAGLKKLYLDEYVDRLKHREIKSEYGDILILKNDLWSERLKSLKQCKSANWTVNDLDKVIRSLKRIKRQILLE